MGEKNGLDSLERELGGREPHDDAAAGIDDKDFSPHQDRG